jgi:acetylornithine aminotransferase
MEALAAIDGIAEVRGRGLMVGVSLSEGVDAGAVAARALDAGLVINVPGPGMLRFLPPLVIDEADVEGAAATMERALV